MRVRRRVGRSAAAGFTLIELMMAILLLLVGIVAVAQLIPAAIQKNFQNRYDSTALILAERQLEQMTAQDMMAGNPAVNGNYFFNTTLPDGTAIVVNLGVNSPPGPSDVGANIVKDTNGNLFIDWNEGAGSVPVNYRNQYVSTEGYLYETRWRVMTFFQTINGVARPVGKRILISTRGGPQGLGQPPTTLMTQIGWLP